MKFTVHTKLYRLAADGFEQDGVLDRLVRDDHQNDKINTVH